MSLGAAQQASPPPQAKAGDPEARDLGSKRGKENHVTAKSSRRELETRARDGVKGLAK